MTPLFCIAAFVISPPLKASAGIRRTQEAIVFSAQKYRENLGTVYSVGAEHLYYLEENGKGLRQLTFGKRDDMWPVASLDHKRVLFWRHFPAKDQDESEDGDDGVYALYSVGLNGKGLRRLWESDGGGDGFALTYERFHKDPIVEKEQEGTVDIYVDPSGKEVPSNLDMYYAADGLHMLAIPFDPSGERKDEVVEGDQFAKEMRIYDLKKGGFVSLSPKFTGGVWVGSHEILATSADEPNTLVLLDEKGKELVRHDFGAKRLAVEGEDTGDGLWGEKLQGDAYPLWNPGLLLLKGHHAMSDGGYDYTIYVDLIHGKYHLLDAGGVEAVSRQGSQMLSSVYAWVGGYKGQGAAKLCKLYLSDLRTGNKKQLGFRRMTLDGACFVPSVLSP